MVNINLIDEFVSGPACSDNYFGYCIRIDLYNICIFTFNIKCFVSVLLFRQFQNALSAQHGRKFSLKDDIGPVFVVHRAHISYLNS